MAAIKERDPRPGQQKVTSDNIANLRRDSGNFCRVTGRVFRYKHLQETLSQLLLWLIL